MTIQEKDSSLTSKYRADLAQITPLYSPLDIQYNQAMSGEYEDLSYEDEDCLVIAGLKDGRITGFWRPAVVLGKPKAVKKQMERLWSISHNIFYVDFMEGAVVSEATKFLLQKGLVARPTFTQIIDLTKSQNQLHADIRKSYTSLINQANYSKFIDAPRAAKPDYIGWSIKPFRQLHESLGGSRTSSSWDVQRAMIIDGQGFVSGGYINNEIIAAGFFAHNYKSCHYFSGKSLPDVNSHAVIWQAILHAKSLGCQRLEMGEQQFQGTQKELGIALFKAGFGGKTYTRLLIGE